MRLLRVLLLSVSLASGALAQAPQPPEVAARSYVVYDVTTGQTLAERNADQVVEPASLTKLMTAYLVFAALKEKRLTLEQTLPVSRRAWEQRKGGGSLMFIDTTMTPKVDELLKGLIVQSGNDAAIVLAEGVGGTVEQFVAMMNRQGQALGLKQTGFKNPTGLTEPGHTTTAREIAILATRIIKDFPEYYPYYALQEYRYNNITQPNRNLLLRRDPTVDGMKTGFTDGAGYCLLATAERPYPNLTPASAPAGTAAGKRRVLTVVMQTASMEARAAESQRLLNWGFQAFETMRLLDAGTAVATVPVWKGVAREAKLGPARSVLVSVPRGEGARLKTRVERSDPLVAPLAKDQAVGRVVVTTAADTPVAEMPLVVLEPIEQAGILGRAWDALRLWIK